MCRFNGGRAFTVFTKCNKQIGSLVWFCHSALGQTWTTGLSPLPVGHCTGEATWVHGHAEVLHLPRQDSQNQVEHKEGAYDDEGDEVHPVPGGPQCIIGLWRQHRVFITRSTSTLQGTCPLLCDCTGNRLEGSFSYSYAWWQSRTNMIYSTSTVVSDHRPISVSDAL